MGPASGLVAPGRPTSYVPSTVLIARRSALGDGFDESLVIGEDVDLVWRLAEAGWRVRYEPAAEVWHDHPDTLRKFIVRRHRYARSIGMLARRHPDALPAMWVSPALAVPWVLSIAGRPRAALAATTWAILRTRRRLRTIPGAHSRLAGAIVARGLGATGLALAHAVRRAWAPPLLGLALRRPHLRVPLLAAFAAPVVRDARTTRRGRAILGDVPMRLLDEVVACLGTWQGCLEERTVRPLLPAWYRP